MSGSLERNESHLSMNAKLTDEIVDFHSELMAEFHVTFDEYMFTG